MLLIVLTALWSLLARPLTPLDETRAAGVAWEMWLRGDFLVPYLNGHPYSHKPPLLQWLINLGWAVFGVNDWWPRLLGPLIMLAGTLLVQRLARELRPDDRRFRQLAAWLMVASLGWLAYGQMLMYDALLTTCVVAAMIGLWRAGASLSTRAWWLVALGIGFGILAKGPVTLVHVLVPALLAPWWSDLARSRPWTWYGRLGLATLGGLAIAGAWAGSAALLGGDEYARMILLEQTSGRVVESFAHGRPWWAYLLFMPLLILPWVGLPSAWKGVLRGPGSPLRRFLMSWGVGCLVVLSLVSAKQPHYVVPEIPAFVLLIAAGLPATFTMRRLALSATAWVLLLLTAASAAMWKAYPEFDMQPPARLAYDLQEAGVPLATLRFYRNQLAFPGRLTQPLEVVHRDEVVAWFRDNPQGVLITFRDELPPDYGLQIFAGFPYRRGRVEFLSLPGNERVRELAGAAQQP